MRRNCGGSACSCCSCCRCFFRSSQFAPLPRALQIAFAVLSLVSATAGVLVERWLFFAEAEHVVVVDHRGGSA